MALFSLFCIPALAQDTPVGEVYGGFQLLRHPGGDNFDSYFLKGFLGAFEGNINSYLGVVGEVGHVRKSWDEEDFSENENFTPFLFGPRFGYRTERVRVFGHYLLGGIRYAYSYSDSFEDFSASGTQFSQAVGGGVDIALNDTISIRPAQVDVVMVRWSEGDFTEWENLFRYSGGIVIKFGSR